MHVHLLYSFVGMLTPLLLQLIDIVIVSGASMRFLFSWLVSQSAKTDQTSLNKQNCLLQCVAQSGAVTNTLAFVDQLQYPISPSNHAAVPAHFVPCRRPLIGGAVIFHVAKCEAA